MLAILFSSSTSLVCFLDPGCSTKDFEGILRQPSSSSRKLRSWRALEIFRTFLLIVCQWDNFSVMLSVTAGTRGTGP